MFKRLSSSAKETRQFKTMFREMIFYWFHNHEKSILTDMKTAMLGSALQIVGLLGYMSLPIQNIPVLPLNYAVRSKLRDKQQTFEQFVPIHYRSLQVLLTRYSPLTTWLMRNKLVHKQAKNLRGKKQKAWETKARRWTSHADGKTELSSWHVIPNERAQRKLCKCFFPHGLQKLRCSLFWRSQTFP